MLVKNQGQLVHICVCIDMFSEYDQKKGNRKKKTLLKTGDRLGRFRGSKEAMGLWGAEVIRAWKRMGIPANRNVMYIASKVFYQRDQKFEP